MKQREYCARLVVYGLGEMDANEIERFRVWITGLAYELTINAREYTNGRFVAKLYQQKNGLYVDKNNKVIFRRNRASG